jgi:hypothetical protein
VSGVSGLRKRSVILGLVHIGGQTLRALGRDTGFKIGRSECL